MGNFVGTAISAIVTGIALSLALVWPVRSEQPFSAPSRTAERLIAAARAQVGITIIYDPAFVPLAYPGGDLARSAAFVPT